MENSCIYDSKRIARTASTHSTGEDIRASFELITRRVSVVTIESVDVRLTEITGDCLFCERAHSRSM